MRDLLHISDIHFGPHHMPWITQGVLDLVERRRPDLVVISGDLTQRAKARQFEEARNFVDRLPVPFLAVPGNHDVPMYRVWERLLAPYGTYRKYFDEDLEPVFEDEALAVIGLNTAWNFTLKDGRVTRRSLVRLAERLDAVPAHKARLLVAHHQLVPPPRFDTQRVLLGAPELISVLREGGVELVLSGHLHQTWISDTEAYYPGGGRPVLLLHSGTTTSSRGRGKERRRNTCNWVRIDDERIEIVHLGWRPESRETGAFVEESRHLFPRRAHTGAAAPVF